MWIGAEPKDRACSSIFDIISVARKFKYILFALILVFWSTTCIIYVREIPMYSATVYMEIVPLGAIYYPINTSGRIHQLTLDDIQVQNFLHMVVSDQVLLYSFCQMRYTTENSDPVLCGRALDGSLQDATSAPSTAYNIYRQAFFDFKGTVSARRIDLSYVIAVTVWSSAPNKAVRAANSVAMSYIHKRLEDSIASVSSDPSPHRELLNRLELQSAISNVAVSGGTVPGDILLDSNVRLFGSAKPDSNYFPQFIPMMLLSLILSLLVFVVAVMVVKAATPRIYSSHGMQYALDHLDYDVPTFRVRRGIRLTSRKMPNLDGQFLQKVQVLLSAAGLYSDIRKVELVVIASGTHLNLFTQMLHALSHGADVQSFSKPVRQTDTFINYSLKPPLSIRLVSSRNFLTSDFSNENSVGTSEIDAIIVLVELGHATIDQVKAVLSAIHATTQPLIAVLIADCGLLS